MKKKIIFSFIFAFLSLSIFSEKVSAACGDAFAVCCATVPACGSGLSCIAGHCTPGSACGSAGLACCAGNICDSGLNCISGSCGSLATSIPNTTPVCHAPQPNHPCLGFETSCNKNGVLSCCNSPTACTLLQSGTIGVVGKTDPTCANNPNGIDTAIGCIDFQNTDGFVGTILKWGAGIGGGIAFLLILMGSFSVMTSAGNPERLKDGQSIISAAVSGLILLILCIFVLKFIGIDILGLGAFGFGP